MKKVLLACLTLTLLSCSKDDASSTSTQLDKNIQTSDPNIGYESPYNFYGSGSNIEHNQIDYFFINETDYYFYVTPNFGIGFHINDGNYYGNGSMFNTLGTGGQVYGNYVPADELIIKPYSSHLISSFLPVPNTAIMSGPNLFSFSNPIITSSEKSELAKRGKLFFYDFSVLHNNTPIVANERVKLNFPYDVNSSTGLPAPWANLPFSDNHFADELIFNKETLEVCSTISSSGIYKNKYTFNYGGVDYLVFVEQSTYKVIITLQKVI